MSAARAVDPTHAPPPPKPLAFRGRCDPYITVAELCALLNAASEGHSRWTVRGLRAALIELKAVKRLPAQDRRRTSRRLWGTTRDMLREHAPDIYAAISLSISEGE